MSEQEKELTVIKSAEVAMVANDPMLNWMEPSRFEHIQRVAAVLCKSELVPAHFRGKLPDCVIGVQLAFRLGLDPFMLMQRIYVVKGRVGMEAQLMIALVNRGGHFAGPLQWRWSDDSGPRQGMPSGPSAKFPDDLKCTAWAVSRANGEVCEAPVSWATVRGEGWLDKDGSKWKTMPEQMFKYRSAAFFARLFDPNSLLGMPTADELEDLPRIVTIEQEPTTAEPAPAPVERADVAALEKIERDGGLRRGTVERLATEFFGAVPRALTAEQGQKIAAELDRRIQANHEAAMAKRMTESAPREAERLLEVAEAAQEEVRL